MALRGVKVAAALRLFKSGLTVRQVARALGCKVGDIHAAIRKAL